MKIGPVRLAGVSVALLLIQLALVGSIAAKYLYQRWRCPRVWTRATAYDPDMFMRGRYLSLQVTVDGCQSTLPSHAQARFPRKPDGTIANPRFAVSARGLVEFPAKLAVKDGRLLALRLPEADARQEGPMVQAGPGSGCDEMRMVDPVNFYITEHAASPLPLKPGEELWMEVTVPPKGPPRPLQLAVKKGAEWRPQPYQ
jgi:hypothetical protein